MINIRVRTKLQQYFENNGLQKAWFARQLGMSKSMLYGIMMGVIPLSKKYFYKIVEKTNGYVTYEDVLSDYLFSHLTKVPLVKLQEDPSGKKWIVTADAKDKAK